MIKLFSKRIKTRPHQREIAPQLAYYQRQVLAVPGATINGLPAGVYQQMLSDSMVQTAMTIKRLAVTAVPYHITPSSDTLAAKRNADFVGEVFEKMEGSPLTILIQSMDAFVKGWSVQEMVYRERRGRLVLEACRPKDPAMFGLVANAFGTVDHLNLLVPGETERRLDRRKFVLYMNRSSYGRPKGTSDLDAAFTHYQAKQKLLAAWRLHLERYASPTVIAKYERGAGQDELVSMQRALDGLEDNTSILYPNDIEIGTLGGHREQTTGFLDAIEFHNREIARSILGQTLTTDEGRRVGSLALGKVHLQVLLLQINALRAELADTVMTEQVIRPLVEMNFGPGDIPRFEFEDTSLDAFVTGKV